MSKLNIYLICFLLIGLFGILCPLICCTTVDTV